MATLCDGEGSAVCAEEMAKLNWNFFSNSFYLPLLSISLVIWSSASSAPVNHEFECTDMQ